MTFQCLYMFYENYRFKGHQKEPPNGPNATLQHDGVTDIDKVFLPSQPAGAGSKDSCSHTVRCLFLGLCLCCFLCLCSLPPRLLTSPGGNNLGDVFVDGRPRVVQSRRLQDDPRCSHFDIFAPSGDTSNSFKGCSTIRWF